MTYFGMSVNAGYVSDEYPRAVTSPDGKFWTLVEELPYYEDYGTFTEDGKHWNKRTYSFWLESGTEISTGVAVSLPVAGAGQHVYDYPRSGEVPVSKWVVAWDKSKCIHNYYGGAFGGFANIDRDICYNAYWSGLLPYCADCGEELVHAYHYISVEAAKQITSINVDKAYYFMCPHMDEHGGLHLEQTADEYEHTCRAVSYNQCKVVYDNNASSTNGTMLDSYHMYNNAT